LAHLYSKDRIEKYAKNEKRSGTQEANQRSLH